MVGGQFGGSFRQRTFDSSVVILQGQCGDGRGWLLYWRTQRLQNPLIKEYALNHIRVPIII